MHQYFLRLPAVLKRVGLSRSSIYSMISTGEFPKSIRISKRSVAWLETDVSDWIDERVLESRSSQSLS
jgi:prophage regulatory protein